MFISHLIIGIFELLLSIFMSGLVIHITYRVFIGANPDFNMEAEIQKGNVAVGTLVAAILFSASSIMIKVMTSIVGIFRMHLLAPGSMELPVWKLIGIALSHLVFALVLALITVSYTLRLFGHMGRRRNISFGKELEKGNIAVGILLAGVVIVSSLYVGEGLTALSKALIPQPSLGHIATLK